MGLDSGSDPSSWDPTFLMISIGPVEFIFVSVSIFLVVYVSVISDKQELWSEHEAIFVRVKVFSLGKAKRTTSKRNLILKFCLVTQCGNELCKFRCTYPYGNGILI